LKDKETKLIQSLKDKLIPIFIKNLETKNIFKLFLRRYDFSCSEKM